MRLILIGCEYVGTTALGDAIKEWAREALGAEVGFHEHWKIPHVAHSELTDEEQLAIPCAQPQVEGVDAAQQPRIPHPAVVLQ